MLCSSSWSIYTDYTCTCYHQSQCYADISISVTPVGAYTQITHVPVAIHLGVMLTSPSLSLELEHIHRLHMYLSPSISVLCWHLHLCHSSWGIYTDYTCTCHHPSRWYADISISVTPVGAYTQITHVPVTIHLGVMPTSPSLSLQLEHIHRLHIVAMPCQCSADISIFSSWTQNLLFTCLSPVLFQLLFVDFSSVALLHRL